MSLDIVVKRPRHRFVGSLKASGGQGRNDPTPAEYADGAVIIDLVDARTKQLLWGGTVWRRPPERAHLRKLNQTGGVILDQLPAPILAMNR
jgi:hypothetical protein